MYLSNSHCWSSPLGTGEWSREKTLESLPLLRPSPWRHSISQSLLAPFYKVRQAALEHHTTAFKLGGSPNLMVRQLKAMPYLTFKFGIYFFQKKKKEKKTTISILMTIFLEFMYWASRWTTSYLVLMLDSTEKQWHI